MTKEKKEQMEKEFNLSEERKELFKKAGKRIPKWFAYWIESQDKEFIKLLKEKLFLYDSCGKCIPKKVLKRANEGILKKINKLAGDKLI